LEKLDPDVSVVNVTFTYWYDGYTIRCVNQQQLLPLPTQNLVDDADTSPNSLSSSLTTTSTKSVYQRSFVSYQDGDDIIAMGYAEINPKWPGPLQIAQGDSFSVLEMDISTSVDGNIQEHQFVAIPPYDDAPMVIINSNIGIIESINRDSNHTYLGTATAHIGSEVVLLNLEPDEFIDWDYELSFRTNISYFNDPTLDDNSNKDSSGINETEAEFKLDFTAEYDTSGVSKLASILEGLSAEVKAKFKKWRAKVGLRNKIKSRINKFKISSNLNFNSNIHLVIGSGITAEDDWEAPNTLLNTVSINVGDIALSMDRENSVEYSAYHYIEILDEDQSPSGDSKGAELNSRITLELDGTGRISGIGESPFHKGWFFEASSNVVMIPGSNVSGVEPSSFYINSTYTMSSTIKKLVPGGPVRDNRDYDSYFDDLDDFGGNSGSGVNQALQIQNSFSMNITRIRNSTGDDYDVGHSQFHVGSSTDIAINGVSNNPTSLFIGEKIMFQHPTFDFPAGGGVAGNNNDDRNSTSGNYLTAHDGFSLESWYSFHLGFGNILPSKFANGNSSNGDTMRVAGFDMYHRLTRGTNSRSWGDGYNKSDSMVTNSLMYNGLMFNGLMNNGLMFNGLMSNGMVSNGLIGNQLMVTNFTLNLASPSDDQGNYNKQNRSNIQNANMSSLRPNFHFSYESSMNYVFQPTVVDYSNEGNNHSDFDHNDWYSMDSNFESVFTFGTNTGTGGSRNPHQMGNGSDLPVMFEPAVVSINKEIRWRDPSTRDREDFPYQSVLRTYNTDINIEFYSDETNSILIRAYDKLHRLTRGKSTRTWENKNNDTKNNSKFFTTRSEIKSEINVMFNPEKVSIKKQVEWNEERVIDKRNFTYYNLAFNYNHDLEFISGNENKLMIRAYNRLHTLTRGRRSRTFSEQDNGSGLQFNISNSFKSSFSIRNLYNETNDDGLPTDITTRDSMDHSNNNQQSTLENYSSEFRFVSNTALVFEGVTNQMTLMQTFEYSGMEMNKNNTTIAGDQYSSNTLIAVDYGAITLKTVTNFSSILDMLGGSGGNFNINSFFDVFYEIPTERENVTTIISGGRQEVDFDLKISVFGDDEVAPLNINTNYVFSQKLVGISGSSGGHYNLDSFFDVYYDISPERENKTVRSSIRQSISIQTPSSWSDKYVHPDFYWMAIKFKGWGEGEDDLNDDNDNSIMNYSRFKMVHIMKMNFSYISSDNESEIEIHADFMTKAELIGAVTVDINDSKNDQSQSERSGETNGSGPPQIKYEIYMNYQIYFEINNTSNNRYELWKAGEFVTNIISHWDDRNRGCHDREDSCRIIISAWRDYDSNRSYNVGININNNYIYDENNSVTHSVISKWSAIGPSTSFKVDFRFKTGGEDNNDSSGYFYNFKLEIPGVDASQFTADDNLSIKQEVIDYGDQNDYLYYSYDLLAKNITPGQVPDYLFKTLYRYTGNSSYYGDVTYYNETYNNGAGNGTNITIKLNTYKKSVDENGNVVRELLFTDIIKIKYAKITLTAKDGASVLKETMTVRVERAELRR
jgi:hypothetical protein